MTQLLNYTVEGGVAILSMDHRPTNVLSAALRSEVLDALNTALEDPLVGAVVLIGEGEEFSAGRDYAELGSPIAHPNLAELCAAVEAAEKPVVAGLSGTVMGGGLELALACHYRVALQGTQIAMPEVALGVMPGAGGTQRAPRLLGAEATLELFLSGAVMPVERPELAALTDEIAQEDMREATILFALHCIAKQRPVRPTRDRSDGLQDFDAFSAAVNRWQERAKGRGQEAAQAILECVRAAPMLPFDVGLDFERERFEGLVTSDQSRALRHVAMAERRAMRVPELHTETPRDVHTIGIIVGTDRVGADLAVAALQNGMSVVLSAPAPAALELAQRRIDVAVQRLTQQGKLDTKNAADLRGRLDLEPDLVGLSEADMIIEAVGQGREVSRQLVAQLDGIVKDGTVIAVHDAAAQLGPVAQATACPQDLIGLYTPNLHLRTAGAEVVVAKNSGAQTVATGVTALHKMGFLPVRSTAYGGLIGQGVLGACVRAGEDLLRRGADVYEIDRVMRSWGMVLGPFQIADAIGLNAPGLRTAQTSFSTVLYRLGREGRSAQKGWYLYTSDHPLGKPDPEARQIVRAVAEEDPQPVSTAVVSEDEIVKTCLAAMANAGARMLRLGVAAKPSDIDVVMIHSFGFPRWRGGPMQAADDYGLVLLRAQLRSMSKSGDAFWKQEPMFDTLIKNGKNFAAMNG